MKKRIITSCCRLLPAACLLTILMLFTAQGAWAAANTYHIIDLSGNTIVEYSIQGWVNPNSIKNLLISPYVDATYYSNAECTTTITTWGDSDGRDIYVKYALKSDVSSLPDLTGQTAYTMYMNNGYGYVNNSRKLQKDGSPRKPETVWGDSYQWYFIAENGDPYHVAIMNKATGKYLVTTGNNSNGTKVQDEPSYYCILPNGTSGAYALLNISTGNAATSQYCYPYNITGSTYMKENKPYNDGGAKTYFDKVVDPYHVTYHVRANGLTGDDEVVYTQDVALGDRIALPDALKRYGTSNIQYREEYSSEPYAENKTITADMDTDGDKTFNIYVTYDYDEMFSPDYENLAWYTLKNDTHQLYYNGNGEAKAGNNRNSQLPEDRWAFVGTPYKFEIVNYKAGNALHAATNSTDNKTNIILSEDATTYPYYYWEAPYSTKDASKPAFRLIGSECAMDFASSSNSGKAWLYIDNNSKTTALTVSKVELVTFKVYDSDGTMNFSATYPATSEDGMKVEMGSNSTKLEKELLRRYVEFTAISENADFSSPVSSYTISSESAGKTIYLKWEYTDDAPVFGKATDAGEYQYYMLKPTNDNRFGVTGDAAQGYSVGTSTLAGEVTDHNHQFAFVGNPYAMHLYSRYAGKYVGCEGTAMVIDNDANGVEFELMLGESGNFIAINKATGKTINGNANTSWTLADIVVPLNVFSEDNPSQRKDYQEYALSLNGAAADSRITTDMLTVANNDYGTTHDYAHAFCDYTFYGNSALTAPVSAEGLPYFGGKEQQRKEFFAAYTVDLDAFERIYYMDDSPNNDHAYISKNAETTNGYTTGSHANLENPVKTDVTDIYRWQFSGDPYNMQIHNLSMGDNAVDYALAARTLTETDGTTPSEDAGTTALLTNSSYGQYSHWEVMKNGDHYVFWSTDADKRYTYSLTTPTNKLSKSTLYVTVPPVSGGKANIRQVEWDLVDVFEHFNVVWHVMDPNGNEVATETKVIYKDIVVALEDMPESLKRHFCNYEKMYSDAACTAAVESITVTEATDLYVPYTLDSSAPDFCESIPNSSTDDKYWYEMRYPEMGSCIFYNIDKVDKTYDNLDIIRAKEASKYAYYRWALVGSPYNVKLYNKGTGTYLSTDGSSLSMDSEGSAFGLYDDYTGDLCAIRDISTGIYITATAGVQKVNNAGGTAAEFTNTNGLSEVYVVLHYSDKTLRPGAAGETETIHLTNFQKNGKNMDDVLPAVWKRAFCNYTYYWDPNTNEGSYNEKAQITEVGDEMVDAYKGGSEIYIHATYDFETAAPFNWSNDDTKHWYYMVNNHKTGNEQGKMVYRDSSPKLRVSTGLQDNRIYLFNFEWCVVGDPYGFRILNHYEPDLQYNQFISVTGEMDGHGDGNVLQQMAGNGNSYFEMMESRYANSFWMHPIYTQDLIEEIEYGSVSFVGQNYNGSAAIIPTEKNTINTLRGISSTNFRLEQLSKATLAEYVKYAGFVGGLQTSLVSDELMEKAKNGTLTEDDEEYIIDKIENGGTVEMKQGYYRIVPYTKEDGENHYYLRGYLDDDERTQSGGMNWNMKVEDADAALYDPASIFWFESTADGELPRYFIRNQGLNLVGNWFENQEPYKSRYENIGAGILQLKTQAQETSSDLPLDYLAVFANSTESTTRNCFEMYNSTRLYLLPVDGDMPLRLKLNEAFGKTYSSLYVPFDVEIAEDCDAKPFFGSVEHKYKEDGEDVYTLYCLTLDYHNESYGEKRIPAGTPVVIRSDSGSATDIVLTLPNDKPTDDEGLAAKNKIEGTYRKIKDTRPELYTFGREKKDDKYTGRVGFFKRSNTENKLNANRVFYISPFYNTGSNGAKGMVFEFESEMPTGIRSYQGNAANQDVYDLQGRRVEHTAKHGIYIVGGKKYVK